ncbi:MAG TPA: Uma2 family endonuclease [Pseudonocardiaceae bacterium]|jgi:Uma2 family endonuclease|nr:Uma2 family endonuclease [Pseudonocardiaceae bacterium]
MTATPAEKGSFTVRDLAGFPDDGNRYELIDGGLYVSTAPSEDHQTVVLELARRLRAARPTGFRVFVAPFAVRPDQGTEVQPDVLVAMDEDITKKGLPKGPLLAVEVLSPSSAFKDRNLKRALYERLGTASYWLIDPIDPTLTVFELDENDKYQLVAEVKGNKMFEATLPFPVRIVPAELLEG